MVSFYRWLRRYWCGPKVIIVDILLALFIGRINPLILPCFRLSSTLVNGNEKRRFGMHRLGLEGDVNLDDKYAYVHPSIQRILEMKPHKKLQPKLTGAKDDDSILVKAEDFTIKWEVLEKFLEHENCNTDAHRSQNEISMSMEQLVALAEQSDKILFQDYNKLSHSKVPCPIRGLLRILPEECCVDEICDIGEDCGAYFLVTTLLALNMIENSIRRLVGKKNGRAPLLKDMIETIAVREGENVLPRSLSPILRTLLLPTNGLNLRNLVWHGFLPTIPRRWFALSVVLTLSLDELAKSSSFDTSSSDENLRVFTEMRRHKILAKVLDYGAEIIISSEKQSSFEREIIQSNIIPRSHTELFRVCLKFIHQPIVFASVVGPLVEHSLRLMWCQENKQSKQIAEPGSYYVTLDGHGQKDKHEVAVMPYVCQGGLTKGSRNLLVYRLGGSTMAFLTDMFTSPYGGPNIRATVAHGLFNKHLFKELIAIERGKCPTKSGANELKYLTSALLSVLCVLCRSKRGVINGTDIIYKGSVVLDSYRPCFSYTALLLAEIGNMVNSMQSFYDFLRHGYHLKYSENATKNQREVDLSRKMSSMALRFEAIDRMQKRIHGGFGIAELMFTDEAFFIENTNNLVSSKCGAAKLLLSEISEAASSSLKDLSDGISMLQSEEIKLSTRRRKQLFRVCSTAQLAIDFYSFAAYCALLYIKRRQTTEKEFDEIDRPPTSDELFVAVKRSRMVVSTFSTTKTFDRALSALEQYIAGKAVQSVNESIRDLKAG